MIERIVVGTDGSAQATKAVRWAADLTKQVAAELLIVHAFDIDPAKLPGAYVTLPQEQLDSLRDRARDQLERAWGAAGREFGISSRTLLVDGNAAGALMDVAEREAANLIVVGSRGRGGFKELLLGGVGHHLVQHSRIPVAIIPSR